MAKRRNATSEVVLETPAAASAPAKPPQPSRQELLAEFVRHREEGKAHYEKADHILTILLKKVKVGGKVAHPVTGEEYRVVDNFEKKNLYFRPCGIRRFELQSIKGTKKTPIS